MKKVSRRVMKNVVLACLCVTLLFASSMRSVMASTGGAQYYEAGTCKIGVFDANHGDLRKNVTYTLLFNNNASWKFNQWTDYYVFVQAEEAANIKLDVTVFSSTTGKFLTHYYSTQETGNTAYVRIPWQQEGIRAIIYITSTTGAKLGSYEVDEYTD